MIGLSGYQEHNEARRKERILQRKANWERQMTEVMQRAPEPIPTNNNANVSESYRRELESRNAPQRPHNPSEVDRQRREQSQKSLGYYSAKLPNRYKNFDYMSQW